MKSKKRFQSTSEEMSKLAAIMEAAEQSPASKKKPAKGNFPEQALNKYQESFVSKKLERTFVNPFFVYDESNPDKKSETLTVNAEELAIPYSALENVVVISDYNPRVWVDSEFEKSTLAQQIQAEGIRDLCKGYRLPGSDKIYIANGGTRFVIAVALYKKAIEDGDEEAIAKYEKATYPVEVIDITEDQMWTVDILVNDSDINSKFCVYENSLRVLNTYRAFPHTDLSGLLHNFIQRTGVKPNKNDLKTLLIFSILGSSFLKELLQAFGDKEFITVPVMNSCIELSTGLKLKEIKITERISNQDGKDKNQSKLIPNLIEYVESLVSDEKVLNVLQILEGDFKKPKTEIPKALKAALPTNEGDTEKATPEKVPTFVKDKPQGLFASKTEVGAAIVFSREDYSESEFKLIAEAMQKKDAKIKALFDEIIQEVTSKVS